MITFKIKTSTGKNFKGEFTNLTSAQDSTLKLLENNGDYLEIMGESMIHRTTKKDGAWHPRNNGFTFDSYDKVEGIKRQISLFKN